MRCAEDALVRPQRASHSNTTPSLTCMNHDDDNGVYSGSAECDARAWAGMCTAPYPRTTCCTEQRHSAHGMARALTLSAGEAKWPGEALAGVP